MTRATLAEGEAGRLRREILLELADDYVGLWDVARMVAEEIGTDDARAVRKNTIRLVEGMLLTGLLRCGLAKDDGGFDPWPTGPEESVRILKERWDGIGRNPKLGEIAWLDSVPRGRDSFEQALGERCGETGREIDEE